MLNRLKRSAALRGVLAALLCLAFLRLAGLLSLTGTLLDSLEFMTFDWRIRHFTPNYQVEHGRHRGDILYLKIDALSFDELKHDRNMRWPWNRRVYAEAIDAMTSAGVELVAFDVFFAEPSTHTDDPGQDAALAEAARRSGRVIFAESADDPLLPELRAAARATAFIEHVTDPDGISRRSRIVPSKRVGSPHSLALTTALHIRGQGTEEVAFDGDPADPDALRLPPVLKSEGGVVRRAHPEIEVPLLRGREEPKAKAAGAHDDGVGSDLEVNFFPDAYFGPEISFYEVLVGRRMERLRGKTVIVGATARDLHDDFATPIISTAGETLPGVKIHGSALATLLEGRPLRRPPGWLGLLGELLLLLPLGAVLARMKPKAGAALAAAAALAVLLAAVAAFHWHRVLGVVEPVAAIALVYVALTAWNLLVAESEKRLIKDLFKQYVTEDVVEEILADPENPLVSLANRRDVTILFADIRNFTSLSESLPPEEVVELLNRFFDRMTGLVFEHGGTLDKYLGDGLLALFGAPVRRATSRVDAVRCALAMQKAAAELVDERLAGRKRPFDGIGVGLHAGDAVVGSIGSEKHREYTAIGSVVNLCSRICSIAPAGTVYVSADLAAAVEGRFNFSAPISASFKGVSGDTQLFAVLGEKKPE